MGKLRPGPAPPCGNSAAVTARSLGLIFGSQSLLPYAYRSSRNHSSAFFLGGKTVGGHRARLLLVVCSFVGLAGCATQKESHTPRTGVEQLLTSSAIDQSLDRVDLSPLRGSQVFLETKYLDCVDKNYVIVSLHHRLLRGGARLVDKPESADVIVEVGSGAVGTDAQELFVGIPEIPLPPPSPIAIPRLAFLTRSKMNGTAKLLVLAYDARTRAPLIQSGVMLARSDLQNWNILGAGPVQSGSVPDQIVAATGESDLTPASAMRAVKETFTAGRPAPAPQAPIVPVSGRE
jgi:hypothetical protein